MASKPFDPTKRVQTRDGRSARIICADSKGISFPIVALYMCDGKERTLYRKANGRAFDEGEYYLDLVNVPEKVERTFMVFKDGSSSEPNSSTGYINCGKRIGGVEIKVTYEDDVAVGVELV